MKKRLGLSAGLLVLAMAGAASAQEAKPQTQDLSPQLRDVFNDSSISIRYQNLHDNNDVKVRDQGEYKLDLRMKLRVIPGSNKLQVVARAVTGTAFDYAHNQMGLGDTAPEGSRNIDLRNVYGTWDMTPHFNLQGGALETLPAGTKGALSIDENGWVDGGRASFSNLKAWANQVVVTVGRVAEFDTPSVLDRSFDDVNFIQVHVRGNLHPRLAYMAEGTDFEEQKYLRGMVELAVKDVTRFVDAIVLEEMMKTGDKNHQGFAASLKKAIGATNLMTQYSYKTADLSLRAANRLPLQEEIKQGHQLTFKADRPMRYGTPYVLVGKTLGSNIEKLSTQGTRLEAGMKIGLGRK